MLRKLMKHEFRATGRIMLPLFGVLLVMAVGANFSIRGLMETESSFLNMLGGLLMVGFFIAMAAVCLMSFALMIRRFYKNLLRDEGYLMMTLPVSVSRHIWSKLIVSTVWFAATMAVVILACCIMAFDIRFVRELWDAAGVIFHMVIEKNLLGGVMNGVLACAEFVILCIFSAFSMCLQFYSAMAIGFGFSNRKMLWSVGTFIGMQAILSMVEGLFINLFNDSPVHYFLLGWTDGISATVALHLSMWLLIGLAALYTAVFFAITVYFLQKRLNLE